MMRYILALILGIICIVCAQYPVAAADEDPDSVSIYDISVYRHLLEDDDWLAVVPYTVSYTDEPDLSIDKTYIFRLVDTDDTTILGSMLAFPYINGGYGDGIISFYFDAASAPLWDTEYTIRVDQNPSNYDTPQTWLFTLPASAYSVYDTQSANQALLQAEIIAICRELEISWSIELLGETEVSTVLSDYGEAYFRNSILGLQTMCPDLFSVEITPVTSERRTWDETFADTFETRYSGYFWGDAMTGFAGLFNVDSSPATAVVSLIIIAILMGLAMKFFKATGHSALMVGFAALGLCTCLGVVSFTLHGFIAFITAVASGVVLFLNRA